MQKGNVTEGWATPENEQQYRKSKARHGWRLYEIPDKEMENEKETKRMEEGQVSIPPSYEVL